MSGLVVLTMIIVIFTLPAYRTNPAGMVHIERQGSQFNLIRNGKPYFIKGVCGQTHLAKLAASGGNTIRTYDTTGLGSILDSAEVNQLAVVAGIYLPKSLDYPLYYDNADWVKANREAITKTVLQYRHNKALLVWCLGNELGFPSHFRYNKFYNCIRDLVDLIHKLDPDHPVTTTITDISKKNIINLMYMTRIDFISFNLFQEALYQFRKNSRLFSPVWNGPYMVLEWGMPGPWVEGLQTSWMAEHELSTAHKADELGRFWREYLPVEDGRCIGNFAFYWGYKQETTQTWFSFFDKDGAASAAVAEMQYLWLGHFPEHKPPATGKIWLENYPEKTDIIIAANAKLVFSTSVENKDTAGIRYDWAVYPEDWLKKAAYINNEKFEQPIDSLIIWQNGIKACLHAPAKEGPYRIFFYAHDQFGNFGSSNQPIYVIGKSNP